MLSQVYVDVGTILEKVSGERARLVECRDVGGEHDNELVMWDGSQPCVDLRIALSNLFVCTSKQEDAVKARVSRQVHGKQMKIRKPSDESITI